MECPAQPGNRAGKPSALEVFSAGASSHPARAAAGNGAALASSQSARRVRGLSGGPRSEPCGRAHGRGRAGRGCESIRLARNRREARAAPRGLDREIRRSRRGSRLWHAEGARAPQCARSGGAYPCSTRPDGPTLRNGRLFLSSCGHLWASVNPGTCSRVKHLFRRADGPSGEGNYLIFATRPSVGNFWNCKASWPGTMWSAESARDRCHLPWRSGPFMNQDDLRPRCSMSASP